MSFGKVDRVISFTILMPPFSNHRCDYRLAVDDDKITIGLSEAAVGLTVPAFVVQLCEGVF